MNEMLTLLANQVQFSFQLAVIAIGIYSYIWIVTTLELRKI